jgi:hypothetical protein
MLMLARHAGRTLVVSIFGAKNANCPYAKGVSRIATNTRGDLSKAAFSTQMSAPVLLPVMESVYKVP